MAHYQLDTRRVLCPLPVIKTQNKVAELNHNDTLEISCTDPGVRNDLPAWCRINGHQLLDIKQNDHGEILVRVQVKHNE